MDTPVNVFIDTSIFINNNFAVNKTMFNTLRSLCQSKKIHLISTDITQNEIESNVEKSINKLKSALKRVNKEHGIVELIGGKGYKDFIDGKTTDETSTEIKKAIATFFNDCNTQKISASEISGNQIFKDYFSQKPPFGKGKKKDEFPDAFVLSALNDYCKSKNTNITTISTDPDFKLFCETEDKFEYFENLYTFINWMLKDEDNVVKIIHNIIENNKEKMSKAIETEIENNGIYIDDADGDVFFQKLLDCEYIEVSVVGLNDKNNKADIFIQADVNLKLETYYWDPNSWYTIKDDGVKDVYYHNRIEGTAERNFIIEVELKIYFNANKSQLYDIENIVVNSGSPLAFYHDDLDDYY